MIGQDAFQCRRRQRSDQGGGVRKSEIDGQCIEGGVGGCEYGEASARVAERCAEIVGESRASVEVRVFAFYEE